MLTISNLSKAYGGRAVLRDISLTVAPGECVGLAGENSCGKTTLISVAAGFTKPDGGSVATQGVVALVPQAPNLAVELTVRENLLLWYAAHRLPKGGIFGENTPEARLGLAEYARTRVKKLSGGRQKRLSIAIALLGNPAILLLDEPFNMLDVWGVREMETMVQEQKALGRAVLLTAHQPMELAAVCDRVALLRDGCVAAILDFTGKSKPEITDIIKQYTNQNY